MNKEISKEKEKKYKILRIIIQAVVLSIFLAGMIYATVKLYPIMLRIKNDDAYRDEVTQYVKSCQGWSFFVVVGAQMIQTILAVIPAGPIVMVSGVLFHPVVGILTCLIGQTLGSVVVYILVKLLGYRFAALFFDPNKIKESKMLKNEEQTEVLMFGYLCIPALPKDITAFIAPFTKIKLLPFAIITFIGRIPMTVVTVVLGSSLSSGNYVLGISLGCVSGLIALLCFIFNKKIVALLERIKPRGKRKVAVEAVDCSTELNHDATAEIENIEIEENNNEERETTDNNT